MQVILQNQASSLSLQHKPKKGNLTEKQAQNAFGWKIEQNKIREVQPKKQAQN